APQAPDCTVSRSGLTRSRCWPAAMRSWRLLAIGVAENSLYDERHVRRALTEPPHEIRIPLLAERHVDADAIAFLHQRILQVPADAVEALEFETGAAVSL